MDEEETHALKARECLQGAMSEFEAGRYNNAANRAYYACFHASIVALLRAGVRRAVWRHEDVAALFAGQLIRRRKMYGVEFRASIQEAALLRIAADYSLVMVSRARTERVFRLANRFVERVMG